MPFGFTSILEPTLPFRPSALYSHNTSARLPSLPPLQLLSICDDMAASNAAGEQGSHVTLTVAQRQRLEQFRQVAAVLESSLLSLEKMIMVFSDF
jgi:hypothetical protein